MASRSLGTLTLDLIAKIFGFRQGMDQAARIAEQQSRRMHRAFSSLKGIVSSLLPTVSIALLLHKITEATEEQEKALVNLKSAYDATGGAVGLTMTDLIEFSHELERTTRFSDENVQQLEANLLKFTNVTGESFKRLVKIILDYATITGKDATEATRTFGVAIDSPTIGLTRLLRQGVNFDNQTKKNIKSLEKHGQLLESQKALLSGLEGRFKGAAEAGAGTFGGSLQQLKNELNNLLEAPGGMTDAVAGVQSLTETLRGPEMKEGFAAFTQGLFGAIGYLAKFTSHVADGTKSLFQFFAELSAGPTGDVEQELRRLGEIEIKLPTLHGTDRQAAQEEIRNLRELIGYAGDYGDAIRSLIEDEQVMQGWFGSTEQQKDFQTWLRNELAVLEEKNKILKQLKKTTEESVGKKEPPPTDEFIKRRDKLQEEIALFGKVSDAAKLAYEVETGQLDNVTVKEGYRLVGMQKLLDQMKEYGKFVKDLSSGERQLLSTEQVVPVAAEITTWDGFPAVKNADGSFSTRLTATVEVEELNAGAITNIPTIWEGQILDVNEAIKKAVASGLKFPAFDTIPEAVEAAKELSGSIGDANQQFEKSANLMERYKQLRADLLEINLASVAAAQDEADAYSERTQNDHVKLSAPTLAGGDITGDVRGEAFYMDDLNDKLEESKLNVEDWKNNFIQSDEEITQATIQAARNIQSAFADFLFDPFEDGLKGMLKGMIDILRRMVSEIAASQILNALGGTDGFGGLLGKIFGPHAAVPVPGKFASGGSVAAGTVAVVGEQGPELALFGSNANIIPNDALGQSVTINNYMDNRGASQDLIRALPRILDERDKRIAAGFRDAKSRGKF